VIIGYTERSKKEESKNYQKYEENQTPDYPDIGVNMV
jgi:hypothetical protein